MECGTKLERRCANCQTIYPEGAKFCMECGNSLQSAVSSIQPVKQSNELASNSNLSNLQDASPPLAGAGGWIAKQAAQSDRVTPKNRDRLGSYPVTQPKAAERRQLTCLFCDLVGSTALSEQLDAEDFRQVILDYQQIAETVINQHGGHIAQYLGDGLLVYFGYPKGLENAPKAGVQAGLGILEAVAKANGKVGDTLKVSPTFAVPINIRIGIHTGLVVVDDHLALGDTVNIAARLEGFEYIAKAFALDKRSDERVYHARLYQLQGDLLVQTNQPAKAEKSYHQAITIAQEQSAKWFELLAAKSLALLWQSQGKTAEAYEVLHGVYSWFTEGFDTVDMVEAKGLIAELKTQIERV